MYLGKYIASTIKEKRDHEFEKRAKVGAYMGEFRRKKGKG